MDQGLDTRFAKPVKVSKGWGYELVIINTPLYCGKIMHFNKDAKFSMHFHIKKTETWYINSGKFEFRYIDTTNADVKTRSLNPGDVVTNEIGQPHQIICLEEGDVFEVSTQHFDEDSYRVAKGDSQKQMPQIEIGVFLSHMGLGDHIVLAPAVAFLARQCQKLYVFCKDTYLETVRPFFAAYPNVSFLTVPSTNDLQVEVAAINKHLESISANSKVALFASGHFKQNPTAPNDFPIYFYKDMNLDWASVAPQCTFPTTDRSSLLAGALKAMEYAFVHNTSSNAKVSTDSLNIDRCLHINPDYNMYNPGHRFYDIAEQFIRIKSGLSMLDYKCIIENAAELYMVDSSYFAFACMLSTQAKRRTVISRNQNKYPTLTKGEWIEG